jgi:hypothetical protein
VDAIKKFIGRVLDSAKGGLRRFVAFAMIMFFLGTLFGFMIPVIAERTQFAAYYWLALPLVLALLAYASSEVAFILFLCMLGAMLVVLL